MSIEQRLSVIDFKHRAAVHQRSAVIGYMIGYRLLVIGHECRPLRASARGGIEHRKSVIGFLVSGYRLPDIGCRTSNIGYRIPAIGYRILVIGHRISDISDTSYRMVSVIGYRLLVMGYRLNSRYQHVEYAKNRVEERINESIPGTKKNNTADN